MPPDRNSFSPLPSTSSARDKAAVARGLACLACRKRKVKCDSVKPICSGCYKYAKGDNAAISCVYDDMTAPKKKRSSPGTVAALEASNAALQAELDELKEYMAQSKFAPMDHPDVHEGSSFRLPFSPGGFTTSAKSYDASTVTGGDPSNTNRMDAASICSIRQDPRGSAFSAALDYAGALGGVQGLLGSGGPTGPESSSDDFWNQLIYPGWPKDLPSFDLTSRLLEVWFSKPHCLTGLINPAQFRAAMLHPPTTSGFPHSALIHSMMAIASMLVSEDFFANEPRYWPLDQKVTEYHAARGKIALDQAIAHGQRLIQVSQAVCILSYWAYTSARFVELWLLVSMATRMLSPLGLNQLASPPDPNRFKIHLLPPPRDDTELNERATNCWYAFMSDRFASACTGWAHSLDEADVVSLLPTDAPSSLAGDFETSPLSPRSPAFFLAHPPHLVGPQQLELKAIILLGRVNTFVQRAPLASQRDQTGLTSMSMDVRQTDAFRKLENDIIQFQASIPREYQSTGAATLDPRLHIVHSLPAAVMILLHERFVTMQPGDPSGPVTLRYSQQVMQVLHSVVSTSFEIGLLSPFINYVWVVAGRNMVREIAFRMVRKQGEEIDSLRGDVQTILLALHACKTPLGSSTAAQLQTLLDDPYRLLPNGPGFYDCLDTQLGGSCDSQTKSAGRGGGGPNDTSELLRSTYSSYPGSDFASVDTPSSTSSYKPFTPPLSTVSTHSSAPTTSSGTEKTFQEIDETLVRSEFFGKLGGNSFGPELEALIHGSRTSAPWLNGGKPAEVTHANQIPNGFPLSNGAMSTGGGRFEELDSHDLIRMGSLSSIFGTTEK
ncbi:hypothetical protein JCM11491_001063 [Sporobolomyces phaffii]